MSILSNSAIIGLLGAPEAAGGEIERSVRFNSSDSAYLGATFGTPTDQDVFTLSMWVKRSALGSTQHLFGVSTNHSFGFTSGDALNLTFGGSSALTTTALFRDPSAWYHIVWTQNGTSHTIYVNNVSVGTATATSSVFNTAVAHQIGAGNTTNFFNGYLADVHFIDGQALDPTSFTEVDATTGQLIPKAYSGTYGTNGFHLLFSDNSTAAALGTDTSGNGNDWTVNNIAVDNPITLPGVAFDNNGDYLSLAQSNDFSFGTDAFTCEGYFYFKSLQADDVLLDFRGNGGTGWVWFINGSAMQVYDGGLITASTTALSTGRWYHLAISRTSSGTLYYFVDGAAAGTASWSTSSANTNGLRIAARNDTTSFVHGFISNLRVLKGTALYTSNFTPPTAPLANVTNTRLLCCQSSSSTTAAAVSPGAITANGDVYATTFTDSQPGNDSLVDTPTNGSQTDTGVGGEVVGNYCTLNPLDNALTLSNGNLDYANAVADNRLARGTIAVSSGKWYWECTALTNPSGVNGLAVGIQKSTSARDSYIGQSANGFAYENDGEKRTNNTTTAYGAAWGVNDIIGIAFDADNGTITFYKNGVSQGQAYSGLTSGPYSPAFGAYASSGIANFGQRPFAYTAPSGFKALCTTNLPAPVVTKPSEYMDIALYTGNGGTQTISGLEFSPDLVWVKQRSGTAVGHSLHDTVRGTNKHLASQQTDAELDVSIYGGGVTSFNSDGFDIGSWSLFSGSSQTYVAWTWDAGSSTVSNTDGSITSQVRANPTAGFSIVTWTGNGTVGHGLGVAPVLYIWKRRNLANNWGFNFTFLDGSLDYMYLNLTNAKGDATQAAPTSTVITIPSGDMSGTDTGVLYAFAPVAGYSSFGSYTGNGSADGPFVYTGMRPKWILIKCSSLGGSGQNWIIVDTARNAGNVGDLLLRPNLSDAEVTYATCDALSNGFKLRNTDNSINGSSQTYIYAAFAESPQKFSRAR